MLLDLDRIRLDGATQPRAELLKEVMEEYAELMRNGVKFPPVTVFFDGTDYWLADGFHRVGAAMRAFPSQPIDAEVLQGTQAKAQWYSFGANKTHGLRRTNGDKVRAVKAALSHVEGTRKSDRQIAEHVGVSHEMVRKHRRGGKADCQPLIVNEPDCQPLTVSGEGGAKEAKSKGPRLRKGRDGRTINTAKIGAHQKGRKTPRISPKARPVHTGHSMPIEMIPLQFSPNNPQTAAATLWQMFPRSFVQALVQDLSNRLTQGTQE